MTELMDGVVYDWTPKEPMKHPSGAFEDVIRFLNSNFMIFTKLPVSTCVYDYGDNGYFHYSIHSLF